MACCGCCTTSICPGRRRGPCTLGPTARLRSPLKKFPALIAEVARDHPEAERLEIWFLDEARVGQTGRVCRRWYQKGLRPRGVRDLRHQAACLFGAVCSERDAGVGLVLQTVSAAAMQAMLDELGQAISPDAHDVVLMDRAGWHIANNLTIPANLTPRFLPPYSPELNAIERVWLYLREHFLSHRLWPSYDNILDACCASWTPCSPKPVASTPWPSSTGQRSVLNGIGITQTLDQSLRSGLRWLLVNCPRDRTRGVGFGSSSNSDRICREQKQILVSRVRQPTFG
jgi:hypothetical protein